MRLKGNIEYCGKIPHEEMVDFINDCSCVLRCTSHDGFPQLPIQYMLCGRDAVVTTPDDSLKYTTKLSFEEITPDMDFDKCKAEVIDALYEIKDSPSNDEKLSEMAHKYYSELMSVDKYVKRIYKEVNN